MTTRDQIIEAMARAIMDAMLVKGAGKSDLAAAALDAALPMLADEAGKIDVVAAEAIRALGKQP